MSRGTIVSKLWLLLCCVAASRQSLSIKGFDVPQAVQAGQDVELKCSYELRNETDQVFVKWWLIPLHDANGRMQLYQRTPSFPGVSMRHNVVLKPNEQDTIVLTNVTPFDSGTYECEVFSESENRKHQDLIVFTPGTGPQLNVTTVTDGPDEDEEEDVSIQCEASGVAPLPDFILTVNSVEVNMTELVSGPDDKGLYEIFGNATVSQYEADGADLRCELVYVNPNVTHPPYFSSEAYSGGVSTTGAPEDTTEPATTPDSLQDERGHSCQPQASWILLLVPVIARLSWLV